MSDFGILHKAATAISAAPDLFTSDKLMEDNYPVLKKYTGNIDSWWDSLNWDEKLEVGTMAVHNYVMKPSYCFDLENTKFNDLKKRQKNIIKKVVNQRKHKYAMFYLPGMLGL